MSLFDEFLEQYRKEKDAKTVQKYVTLKKRIEEIGETELSKINFGYYDRFKEHLYNQPNPKKRGLYFHNQGQYWTMSKEPSAYPVGLFDDTVFKMVGQLQTFLAWAVDRGHKVDPAFKKWPVIERKHEPLTLTMDEIERIESVQLTPEQDLARDYFLLEFYTLQRISDVKSIKVKDLVQTDKGLVWEFYRKKGARLHQRKVSVFFKLPHSSKALPILQKYNFNLPTLSEQKINKHIKKICAKAGINQLISIDRYVGSKLVRSEAPKCEFISTHSGRRSGITIMALTYPQGLVMQLAGIENEATYKRYAGLETNDTIQRFVKDQNIKMKIA